MKVSSPPKVPLTSRLIENILAFKPLANFAKNRARNMMVNRAEAIGVPWRKNVQYLSTQNWESIFEKVENQALEYPSYYTTSFHAYDQGNLSWKAAWEVESAAQAVHAKIWSDGDIGGDSQLRHSYHQVLLENLSIKPQSILDLGCGVGMSTLTLQNIYPQSQVTGLDLSPYFLSVAMYRGEQSQHDIQWIHGSSESTGLADQSFDLVSACLMFHELPKNAAQEIIAEAHRLLKPGGYLTIMDMNPQSEVFQKMPPYILTLLKSTEPYLDQYLDLDLRQVLAEAGFREVDISTNSPRHRTAIARAS